MQQGVIDHIVLEKKDVTLAKWTGAGGAFNFDFGYTLGRGPQNLELIQALSLRRDNKLDGPPPYRHPRNHRRSCP
jgi:hypothetical protein